MDPEQQRAYWNGRIAAWDSSTYRKGRSLPRIERLASLFRGNLRARRTYALDVIKRAAPRKLIEVGCGTGELFASLPAATTIERYVGIDISAVAIEQARTREVESGLRGRSEFIASSARNLEPSRYGDFDFVLMLGLLPYLTDDEFETAAGLIRGKSFLLDYHSAEPSVRNLMHWFYRRLAKHPFYRMHSDERVSNLLRENGVGTFELVHHRGLSFVQHLERRHS